MDANKAVRTRLRLMSTVQGLEFDNAVRSVGGSIYQETEFREEKVVAINAGQFFRVWLNNTRNHLITTSALGVGSANDENQLHLNIHIPIQNY